jgi:1-acyl-sn-glycerol-3-phosphate acyltransferase
MLRRVAQFAVRLLFRSLARVEALGLENIPAQGACILAANHLSRLDGPLVFAVVDRQDVTGLVASTYRKNPVVRLLVGSVRGIWLDRAETDFGALRAALGYLRSGGALGVAPEGTHSRSGRMAPGKPGVTYLATRAGVRVVPIGITGTDGAIRRLLRLQRPQLRIVFGEPFTLPAPDRRSRAAALERGTDEIMCRIAALLPPEYRGVYADHPRLAELLSGERAPAPPLDPVNVSF